MDRNAFERQRRELDALTRREVLKRGVAGASIITAGGFIAACGGSRSASSTTSSTGGKSQASGATNAQVKKGGTLVFAIDALTGNSDPGIFATFGDWMAIDC